MNIKELTIGNFVYLGDDVDTVFEVEGLALHSEYRSEYHDEPIALITNEDCTTWEPIKFLRPIPLSDKWIESISGSLDHFIIDMSFKYVHTLQNVTTINED